VVTGLPGTSLLQRADDLGLHDMLDVLAYRTWCPELQQRGRGESGDGKFKILLWVETVEAAVFER
jgi:hypothetical protein